MPPPFPPNPTPPYLMPPPPANQVGFFLHTPFPSSEIYRTLPVREELLRSGEYAQPSALCAPREVAQSRTCQPRRRERPDRRQALLCSAPRPRPTALDTSASAPLPRAVLKADLIGFHTYDYARHFVSACTRILGLEGTPAGAQPLTLQADWPAGWAAGKRAGAWRPSLLRVATPAWRTPGPSGRACGRAPSVPDPRPFLPRAPRAPRCRRGGQRQPDARGSLPNWNRPRPLHRGAGDAGGEGQHRAAAQQVGLPGPAWACLGLPLLWRCHHAFWQRWRRHRRQGLSRRVPAGLAVRLAAEGCSPGLPNATCKTLSTAQQAACWRPPVDTPLPNCPCRLQVRWPQGDAGSRPA